MNTNFASKQFPGSQTGASLIIIMIIIVIASGGVYLSTVNFKHEQIEVNNSSMSDLKRVKVAILGWAVGHPNTPGMLPWPDHSTDSNYDGNSDCINVTPSHSTLLGRVPWLGQTSPCVSPLTGMSVRSLDATGTPIYYAASPNLVYNYSSSQYPVVDTNTKNLTTGWLTLMDRQGNTVSDRIAFLVIAPGRALSTQQRSTLATANQYLDSVTVNAGTYNNANSNGVFVSGQADDGFNDLIQYITIDQLVALVEKRTDSVENDDGKGKDDDKAKNDDGEKAEKPKDDDAKSDD